MKQSIELKRCVKQRLSSIPPLEPKEYIYDIG